MVFLPLLLAFTLTHPFNPPVRITSSFGEYRTTHLHGGIDYSTGGVTGKPVQAMKAGTIRSVRVTWRGYGKVLYLEHRDGYTSVYAHLDRFSPAIEENIRHAYEERGFFPDWIDLEPPVTVKSGEVIAYSGETGEGPPHLHVELRKSNNPVDPLTFLDHTTSGRVVFRSLTITPSTLHSWINGARGPLTLDLPVKKPITITGPFKLSVNAFEAAGSSKWGLRELNTSLDGKEFMSLDLHSFSYGWSKRTGFIFQRSKTEFSPTRFTYWITPPEGGKIPSLFGSSMIDLVPGTHELTISSGKSRTKIPITIERSEPSEKRKSRTPFLALLTHYIADGKALSYPAEPALIHNTPRVVGGVVKSGEPVEMKPFTLTHSEERRIPLLLQLAESVPESPSPYISPILKILPEDLPLINTLTLKFRTTAAYPEKKTGFYQWNRRWRPMKSVWNGKTLTGQTRTPGKIAVILDDSPPDIQSVKVRKGTITAVVKDALSGLNWDSVTATSGDKSTILIYDPDRKTAKGKLPGRPFTIKAVDRAGNISSKKIK